MERATPQRPPPRQQSVIPPKADPARRAQNAMFGELEAGLRIDQLALDQALQHQPALFYQVAEQYANAVSVRDGLSQFLKETEARIDKLVREFHSQREEKITETAIAGRVRLSGDYQKAAAELADATLHAARLQALLEAYKQRSHALRDLTALHITNYYDGTSNKAVRERMNDQRRDYAAQASRR